MFEDDFLEEQYEDRFIADTDNADGSAEEIEKKRKIMPSNTVQTLESDLAGRGFKLSKKYDNTSGICIVTAYNKTSDLTIISKNSSRAGLWSAYKRALDLIVEQLENYKNVGGVDA